MTLELLRDKYNDVEDTIISTLDMLHNKYQIPTVNRPDFNRSWSSYSLVYAAIIGVKVKKDFYVKKIEQSFEHFVEIQVRSSIEDTYDFMVLRLIVDILKRCVENIVKKYPATIAEIRFATVFPLSNLMQLTLNMEFPHTFEGLSMPIEGVKTPEKILIAPVKPVLVQIEKKVKDFTEYIEV